MAAKFDYTHLIIVLEAHKLFGEHVHVHAIYDLKRERERETMSNISRIGIVFQLQLTTRHG